MSRREHSERVESTPHNKVFSLWSSEELYAFCNREAEKVCKKYGYPGESKDIAHDLWIYLRERGHVVRCPEYKGAIHNFLKKLGRDYLRRRWSYDHRHTSIDGNDADKLELPDNNETAEKIIEKVIANDLLARVEHRARRDQLQMIKKLAEGATQMEIAKSYGVKQYQVSRWITALRQRVKS